jgi:hypothetical protein
VIKNFMNMKFRAALRPLIAVLVAAELIAGCAVGPNYHKPDVQTPAAYHDLSVNPQAEVQAASYADLPWWQVFSDPVLQELIRTALKQNYDLQIATERINAARAQVAITRSSLFPQVQGGGAFTGGKEQFFPAKANILSSGFIWRTTPRHPSRARPVAGDGGGTPNGGTDSGQRYRRRLFCAAAA